MEELKFCYEKTLMPTQKSLGNTQKAVWQKSKYWNKGQTLRVFFINGDIHQRSEMQRAFGEITSHTSLKFLYTTNRLESDIRVSFNAGWGSYSYVGTDALFIPKNMETINIGWRGMDVCRHEALHAMGALHEHQNPNEGIQWNEAEVIRELSGAPNYWGLSDIRHNVLDKIEKTSVDTSKYDPSSVMLYYFPASWTKNGISSNDNHNFSATDIEFMKKIYAIEEKDTLAPKLSLNGESNIVLFEGDEYVELGATAIDNVDGVITSSIVIEGDVDTSKEGLYYKTYNVTDKAGNKSEKIRTIMVQEKFEVRSFLKELFPTKVRLSRLTEEQLVFIADRINITASVDDLKRDTVTKLWDQIDPINK